MTCCTHTWAQTLFWLVQVYWRVHSTPRAIQEVPVGENEIGVGRERERLSE